MFLLLLATDTALSVWQRMATAPLWLQLSYSLLLVLNKSDRYSENELRSLLAHLQQRCAEFLEPENILPTSADPCPETVIHIGEAGNEHPGRRPRKQDISKLRSRLWQILGKEGKTLAALNAALFTSELDEQITGKIVLARQLVTEK